MLPFEQAEGYLCLERIFFPDIVTGCAYRSHDVVSYTIAANIAERTSQPSGYYAVSASQKAFQHFGGITNH